jgi:hypothetical protein
MPKKFEIYWYNEAPELKPAFLFNLRDNDIQKGGKIVVGEIIEGAVGYVAAQETVMFWTGRVVPFSPNRRCEWQGFELRCMVHPNTPTGKVPAAKLRDFNYAVAEVPNDKVAEKATSVGIPVVRTSQSKRVINVELSQFERQKAERRANLLP